METTEYRLSTLETVLAEYIMQTNRNMASLARNVSRLSDEMLDFKNEMSGFKNEMLDFKNEMSDFKNEMSDFKNEMLDFKNEMSDFKNEMLDFKNEMSDFKNEMLDFKNEMSDFKKESQRNRTEMNKKWGEVTNRLGTFAEDFVAPNIPRIARKQFGFSRIDFLMPRVDRRNPKDKSQNFEFDTIVISDEDKRVILTEAKFTVRMDYLKGMPKIIQNFQISFPEYADYELITIFASMSIQENQIKYLTSQNIYAMALGDENMELLNYKELYHTR